MYFAINMKRFVLDSVVSRYMMNFIFIDDCPSIPALTFNLFCQFTKLSTVFFAFSCTNI